MTNSNDGGERMAGQSRQDREHLRIHLSVWPGERLPSEGLVPPTADQRTLDFGYLGDLQFSLVFDPPGAYHAIAAQPEDLAVMTLSPSRALFIATTNLRRRRDRPTVAPLSDGVCSLCCALPDDSAAYLLDRVFWHTQLQSAPQGLIAALPRADVFLFAPAGDAAAEAALRRRAAKVYASAGNDSLSACLYHFDSRGWRHHAELAADIALATAVAERPGADEPVTDLDWATRQLGATARRLRVMGARRARRAIGLHRPVNAVLTAILQRP